MKFNIELRTKHTYYYCYRYIRSKKKTVKKRRNISKIDFHTIETCIKKHSLCHQNNLEHRRSRQTDKPSAFDILRNQLPRFDYIYNNIVENVNFGGLEGRKQKIGDSREIIFRKFQLLYLCSYSN